MNRIAFHGFLALLAVPVLATFEAARAADQQGLILKITSEAGTCFMAVREAAGLTYTLPGKGKERMLIRGTPSGDGAEVRLSVVPGELADNSPVVLERISQPVSRILLSQGEKVGLTSEGVAGGDDLHLEVLRASEPNLPPKDCCGCGGPIVQNSVWCCPAIGKCMDCSNCGVCCRGGD